MKIQLEITMQQQGQKGQIFTSPDNEGNLESTRISTEPLSTSSPQIPEPEQEIKTLEWSPEESKKILTEYQNYQLAQIPPRILLSQPFSEIADPTRNREGAIWLFLDYLLKNPNWKLLLNYQDDLNDTNLDWIKREMEVHSNIFKEYQLYELARKQISQLEEDDVFLK